jgi:hypothetical protein
MLAEKMFDAVIIASDEKANNKVRFCNNLAERVIVLQRDKFTIHDTIQLDRKMTKREIVDYLMTVQDQRKCDEDREAVEDALDLLKRQNVKRTSFDDVRKAILSRKTDDTHVTA